MCLFDKIPQKICLCEPQEQMGFGVTGDSLKEGIIAIRSLTDGNIGKILADEKHPAIPITDYLRSNQQRVLDLKKLIPKLSSETENKPLTPWMLAVELIRAPEEIQFILADGQRSIRCSQPGYDASSREIHALPRRDSVEEKLV